MLKHHYTVAMNGTVYAQDCGEGLTVTNQVEYLLERYNCTRILYLDSQQEYSKYTLENKFETPTNEEIAELNSAFEFARY